MPLSLNTILLGQAFGQSFVLVLATPPLLRVALLHEVWIAVSNPSSVSSVEGRLHQGLGIDK